MAIRARALRWAMWLLLWLPLAGCNLPLADRPTEPATVTTPTATAPAATPSPAVTPAPTTAAGGDSAESTPSLPAPAPPAFYYGMGLPVDTLAQVRQPDVVRTELRAIRALGVNLVVQIFPSGTRPADWAAYLDVAAEEGMLVIGKVGPADWNPDPADLSPLTAVLDAVHDHPALYGFFYLHEPWEVFTTTQMQVMYAALKARYPALRLGASWSGAIELSEQRAGRGDRRFTDGLCDICLVNLKAFQTDVETAQADGFGRIAAAASVIRLRDPDAELWSSVQVWEPAPPARNPRGFRIPTPAEMTELFCTLRREYALTGFFWEVWQFDKPTAGHLAAPDAAANREAVRAIYEQCVTP